MPQEGSPTSMASLAQPQLSAAWPVLPWCTQTPAGGNGLPSIPPAAMWEQCFAPFQADLGEEAEEEAEA